MGELVKKYWPILIILIFAFLVRIWKIEELFYFTYDESIPAFVARRLILWQHIPLIGGVTPFNFHLGPYFYWFYAFILFLGKLNPIALGYAAAVISVITTLLIFLVGKTFGSKKMAITAAILWTFSYLANVYDRHLWALYWGPLISLITAISLHQIQKGKSRFVYLLGATIALGIHADPSNLVFLLLYVVIWMAYRLPVKKSTFIALGLILFSFLPLVIFDLRHNFANTRPVIDFWKQGRNYPGFELQKLVDNFLIFPSSATRLIYTFGDNQIAKQYSYCSSFVREKFDAIPRSFVIISSVVLIIFTIMYLGRGRTSFTLFHQITPGVGFDSPGVFKTVGFRLLSLLILLYFFGIQLYGTIFRADIFEHYVTGLFAVFLLIFAKIISLLPQKLWLVVLAIFVATNLYKLSLTKNAMGLAYKKQAIEFAMQQVGDKEFSLDSLSTCWKYSGYRYLFVVFGREPVKSYVDPNFGYLYGTTQVADKHPATVVAFVIHDFVPETDTFYKRYAVLKSHEIKSALFGAIEVIILDNSTGWFDRDIGDIGTVLERVVATGQIKHN